MSAHVLFYLLNELGKIDKMRGLRRNDVMDVITFPEHRKQLVVYRFYCKALFHSQRHMINHEHSS